MAPFNPIVGSGNQKESLEKHAKEKGINVEFLGNIPNNELPNILNQHEVFILPSLYEGMPKTLLEAMACGLPVIGTDVGGIREIVEHGRNGLLCGTDPKSIRETIQVLTNNEKLKRTLGEQAGITIKEKFSLNRLIEKELKLYGDLIK